MNLILKRELPLIAIALLPIVYLTIIWNELPDKVPMHWNLHGEIDRFGNKTELIFISILLPMLTYLLLLIVPKIDPKNKLGKMGNKFQTLKTILTVFVSALTIFIIYSSKNKTLAPNNYVYVIIGLFVLFLGNYFKTLKPNYFIGIRTPWTLENEIVWKATHVLGGKLWFIGGIIIVFSSLILSAESSFIVFVSIIAIITIVPVAHSYLKFKKTEKS